MSWWNELYNWVGDKLDDFTSDPKKPTINSPVDDKTTYKSDIREEFSRKAREVEDKLVTQRKTLKDKVKRATSSSDITQAYEMLKPLEGYSETVYLDKYGNKTVGVGLSETSGYNVENMTPAEIKVAEQEQLRKAKEGVAKHIRNIDNVDTTRRAALITLAYNMGDSFLDNFPSMRKYLNMAATAKGKAKEEYYKKAAYELLHSSDGKPSKYFKDVGGRAQYIADIIAFGKPLANLDDYRTAYAGPDGHVDESKIKIPEYFK